MKKLFLSITVLLLTVSFAFPMNNIKKVSTYNIEETLDLVKSKEFVDTNFSMEIKNSFFNCEEACVDYADSRDDGSDRTNRDWQHDLDDCRDDC